jgi:hypothetical protein
VITVLTRPTTGAATTKLWPYVRNGLIAAVLSPITVICAVFLYNFVILYPLDQEDKVNFRLSDLEKKLSGPSATAGLDQRIDIIQQQLARAEQNTTSQSALIKQLLRLVFLEGCRERLAAVEDKFDEAAERARNLIGVPVAGPGGGRIVIQQAWDNKLHELQIIAKQCTNPSIDGRLEPTEDEMHTNPKDEKLLPNADQDLICKIRKFDHTKARAAALINNVKAAITGEITNLRSRAGQNIGQP